jgi:hypothetical protein
MSLVSTIATPLQGLLGGVGLALSASLLLFASGRSFGVSGFIHRAFDMRGGWTDTSGRLGDILGVTGLVLGGVTVGALERKYTPDMPPSGSMIGLDILKVAAGGFLVGLGSRVSNFISQFHTVKLIVAVFVVATEWVHEWAHDLWYLPIVFEVCATSCECLK